MALNIFNDTIKDVLLKSLKSLEDHFSADVIFYHGIIEPGLLKAFRDFIEKLAQDSNKKDTLVILLNTGGGSAETVEKFVGIIRQHYNQVYFIIPDFAMSAGTIFCMSGDKIYMDYSSSLGPIDPQVFNGKDWVPALGYLDQVEKMLSKAQAGTITKAEFLILQSQDLAMLSRYEQAKNLTITLLKDWLVKYKFKDWVTHGTNPAKKNQPVTADEKKQRAEEIARLLGDNKLWHSHGRMIGIKTLQDMLKLQIEDYSTNVPLRNLIRSYNDLVVEFIAKQGYNVYLHSRNHF